MILKNLSKIEDYVSNRLILKQKHPTENLFIYNYSKNTAFKPISEWDIYLNNARGLILNNNYNIIARGFKKFWNYDQVRDQIPNEPFILTEKLDGSLGILYWIGSEPFIATRGSFISEQAVKATDILKNKYKNVIPKLKKDRTYLFEILFPQNRIVVNYGNLEDIILLAVLDNDSGLDLNIPDIGFPIIKSFNLSIDQALNYKQSNFEGFVLKFKNGFRCKIKLDDYVRLHRLISSLSTTRIWELLKNDQTFEEYIISLPEEHYDWAIKVKEDLLKEYREIEQKCLGIYAQLQGIKDRKSYAAAAKVHCDVAPVLFKMLDKKSYSDIIWDLIRPDLIKYGQNE